jgi:hypothetical protein
MVSNQEVLDQFGTYFAGHEKIARSQLDKFIMVTKEVTGKETILKGVEFLEANGFIKHYEGATWINLHHKKQQDKFLNQTEKRRREKHAQEEMRKTNDKIVLDWYFHKGEEKLDPHYCPKGIRRIIKYGCLSDSVRERCIEEGAK